MSKSSIKSWCHTIGHNYHPLKLFPIITWSLSYKLDFVIRDLIAGFTIGLMLIPQALAYAELAGLPAYLGLYTSFLGVVTYSVFGSSKHVAIGPTTRVGNNLPYRADATNVKI